MLNHYSDCNRHGRVDPHLEFLFGKIEKNNTQQKRI